MVGKVRWFNNDKGYGFIQSNDKTDIFIHYSSIIQKGYRSLQENDIVEFKLIETSKGLQAIEATAVQMTTM